MGMTARAQSVILGLPYRAIPAIPIPIRGSSFFPGGETLSDMLQRKQQALNTASLSAAVARGTNQSESAQRLPLLHHTPVRDPRDTEQAALL